MFLLDAIDFAEKMLPLERELFFWVNSNRSNFLDTFMHVYTSKHTWIPLAVVFLSVLVYKMHWKHVLLCVTCGLIVGLLCDQIPSEVIKPFFSRPRPFNHPDFKDQVITFVETGGGRFGFVSNHAANGFGIALFSSLLIKYRYFTIMIFLWATITAYSRIYLGIHFITDILGGMLWGVLVALLVYWLFLQGEKMLHIPKRELGNIRFLPWKAWATISTMLLTIGYIVVRSTFFQIVE